MLPATAEARADAVEELADLVHLLAEGGAGVVGLVAAARDFARRVREEANGYRQPHPQPPPALAPVLLDARTRAVRAYLRALPTCQHAVTALEHATERLERRIERTAQRQERYRNA